MTTFIGIHDQGAVRLEAILDGNFFAEHAVQIAKAFQVRSADVRNHGDIGFCGQRKRADFIGTARAHFHDGSLMAVLQLEQRHRHANMVVEVTLRRMGLVFHGEHGLRHLLGGRLAVASGNGDLLHLEEPLVALGELEQRLGGIFHRGIHLDGIAFYGFLVHNAHQRTILFHLRDKLVRIETRSLYRPEHYALGLLA